MKFFTTALFAVAMTVAAAADAEEIACTSQGRTIYDPDFCRAIQISREALDLNRKLLEKSEAIRQAIDRQVKRQFEEMRRGSNPRR